MSNETPNTPPIVLTVAGSDSSGGAGIQADLKTFAAHHVYGATVITALTAQNTMGVDAIYPVTPKFVSQQFNAVATDLDIATIKVGMLATTEIAQAVAECLKHNPKYPIILDPVMVATSGDALLDDAAIEILKYELLPLADVLTPNRAEAAILTGRPPFANDNDAKTQAHILLELGCKAVVMKGGHMNSDVARDLLVTAEQTIFIDHPWVATNNTHGTGCTLSSAIAANLANGEPLENSVRKAKDFVWNALRASKSYKIGKGNGPLDHDFARFSHTKSD